MRQMKRRFSPQQLEELSVPIVARLRQRVKDAQTIVAYYPLPDEVDIRPLLDEWMAEGKNVFLPKVTGPTSMELHRYTGHDGLQEGAFHILEPIASQGDSLPDLLRTSDHEPAPLILVPGQAFDAAGHRLGRGRGYYDRFLNTVGTVLLCQDSLTQKNRPSVFGVCFDFQKVPEVPTDEHDVAVDEVI